MRSLALRTLSQLASGLVLVLVPALVPALVPVGPAWGHGAKLDYRLAPSIEIQAQYDNGDPMAEAQVAVFAPDQPDQPWQTGMTDPAGRFRFSPGGLPSGRWEVQVRQAGHGGVITIPLGGDAVDAAGGAMPAGSTGYSPAQIGLMIALGLWGCLGTGLFFARRRPDPVGAPDPKTPATAALTNPHAHS